jgi:undecaprenyl-phosphate 4-deoxy-4-formamido-L-arabinose transferase
MTPISQISVVIPVYNGAASLADLSQRLETVLRGRTAVFELILVDDGSLDASWDAIRQLAGQHQCVRGIHLMRNYGQHNALLCGIRAARYGTVVTMDDDLQNPPEEVPKLLDKLGEGYEVVYGTPLEQQHGLWRNLASTITKVVLQNAMGARTARDVSAFRAFQTRLRDAFEDFRGPYVSIDVLLTWGTRRFAAIPVAHAPRLRGQSNYTLGLLLKHAVNMMTGFSTIPLRLASLVGFVFTGVGLVLLAAVLLRYAISGTSVPGFVFLASTITIMSGAQLFALGIIGEYLARIHFRVMDRPPYAIASETSEQGSATDASR